ncbi:MBL fold metallo-hydrolase [Halorarum salinum]|uniref:MBL fold metallo-hydrolase n=1 Tax=Halorarum salinum TaxID=2743089 RepID=A0A7D5LB28_9EURY|nr:MBL fold metallo-hydrolase [Halobaculum salinum]QLG62290.1 MBL fold metallo-hydrolase [Halobaculum salinum]
MTEGTPLDAEEEVESIAPEELKECIDSGEDIFILDARSEGDFDEWHIDGENVGIVNYPYFQLLDGIPEDLLVDLPRDQRITVLCAKGGSSEMVAELLEEEGYDVSHLARGMNGWARIHEYHELDVATDTTIAQYQRPSSGCLTYLIIDDDEAAVIDPLRAFVDEYIRDAQALGAEITHAIDTHIHADHISGVRSLAANPGAEIVLPAPADERGIEYEQAYTTVEHGDELSVGNTTIEVVHTPGHTSGMASYQVGEVLFTGDGLFTESVARPDLEDEDAAREAARTLYDTLNETILPLPAETAIAPAHFSDSATLAEDGTHTARLGDLTESMDVLSTEREEFVEFILSDMPPRPANYEDIIATNLGQKRTGDEEAFKLELGPNNCAASQDALTGD